MISKIYNNIVPQWKAGELKGKKHNDIAAEFVRKNSTRAKSDKTMTNDMKARKIAQERFRQLNPHLFGEVIKGKPTKGFTLTI